MASLKTIIKKTIYKITGGYSSLFISRKIVMASFKLKRKLPVNFVVEDFPYFKNEIDKSFDPVISANIKNAFLVVEEGIVIKCLNIVDESLMHPQIRGWYGFNYLLKPFRSNIKLKDDKYLMVYNHYGVGYGHWLADVLPRLYVIRDELKNYKIILPNNYNTFHFKTLAPFGIKEDQIVYLDKDSTYSVPDITILGHIGATCNTKDDILQEMREFYLTYYIGKKKPVPFRKLYISRAGVTNRMVINDAEVEALVLKHGFEIMHPQNHTFEQQITLFAECKALVGLTGSGLTNMLFMQNGCSVVEFKMEDDYNNLHYFSMSSGMNLNYYYLLCKTEGEDRFTANFEVDVVKLEIILKEIAE